MIYAGHGGKDPGAIGARGTYEKDVVLAIAERVDRLMDETPGFEGELMRRIEDMGIVELLGIIRRLPEGERRERALAAALSSLIEVEIEWRLDLRHQNVGFHNISTTGNMGEGRGEITGAVNHVAKAAERYRSECRWRSMAKALLAHVNEHQRMALLLTGYAIPEQRNASRAERGIERHWAVLVGDRGLTLAEVCDSQMVILKRLGWPIGREEIFSSEGAIRKAGMRARRTLLPCVAVQAGLLA